MATTFARLVAEVTGLGWVKVERKSHTFYRCPCGEHQVGITRHNADGDPRAVRNQRRAIKACARGREAAA